MRVVAGHDHEVHQCRRIGCTTCTRTADHRDLWHHPGKQHIGVEHVAIAGKCIDTLLNAGTARILEGHHRHADLEGVPHDAGDLSGLHLAQRAGNDAEILAESSDLRVSYVTAASDHAVSGQGPPGHAGQGPPGHAEGGCAVFGMQTEFLESTFGKQGVEPLASRQQTLGVQRFQLFWADVFSQFCAPRAQLIDQLRSYRHLDS